MSFVRRMLTLLVAILGFAFANGQVQGQELSARAQLEIAGSSIAGSGADILITLALSQPVPWRTKILADPPRLVMDFREVDFSNLAALAYSEQTIVGLRAGHFRPGWSRLVIEMKVPFVVSEAEMQTKDDRAGVMVRVAPADMATFLSAASLPEPPEWQLPKAHALLHTPGRKDNRLVVALDPGHGGIDPGAERSGLSEAKLMLGFARQLKDLLAREGLFVVVMTRDNDNFVPLETRISTARAEGADVLISLHADALEEGEAVGAVIYTLSTEASEVAGATLAERHDRDDLLAGINLAGQDDLVATVLMDMARTETMPRTNRLAAALLDAMTSSGLKMHRTPLQSAGFSVLKSPDVPSVLIELGFLSSPSDLARLTDSKWRSRMAGAIRDGLMIWAKKDAAIRGMVRR